MGLLRNSFSSTNMRKSPQRKKILFSDSTPFFYIREGDFDVVPLNILIFLLGSFLYFVSLYLGFVNYSSKFQKTWLWTGAIAFIGGLSVTAGAHRLWAHKSYSARLPLRIIYMFGQCISGQNSLYIWCRDHRAHHKFSDSDGDPHNTKRGFFFAHVGWLLRKKHPQLIIDSSKLNFSDLEGDPVIRFQHKYYYPLYIILAVMIPTLVPWYYWNEHLLLSFMTCYVARYNATLHATWFVNSTAHMFGNRPYDDHIEPAENVAVSATGLGEGYHNYHHSFPFDYRAAEDGSFWNPTKKFIEFMAFLGLAFNLKTVSDKSIIEIKKKVMQRQTTEKSNS
jgi:stearoyl-CoA desaturase (delta-9 desaturase)